MSAPPDDADSGDTPDVLFESAYGTFPRFFWYGVIPFLLMVSGTLFARAVWFGQGIAVRSVKLSPQVVAWVVCPGMWLLCATIIGLAIYRRLHPQRVILTTSGLQLPKGRFTDETVFIPWDRLEADIDGRRIAFLVACDVTCLDAIDGTTARIASLLFHDFDDFATFARIVGAQVGEDWSIKGFLPGTFRGRK